MAVNLTLNTISSGYNLSKINENFDLLETALQDALSRSGGVPNPMSADIDMNGNNIINLRSFQLEGGQNLADLVDQAAASAAAAATSESNAATSAANAAQSALDAAANAGSTLAGQVSVVSGTFNPTLTDDGRLYDVDTTGGDVSCVLPAISTLKEGYRILINNETGSNNVNITTSGGDTISNAQVGPNEFSIITADDTAGTDNWIAVNAGTGFTLGPGDVDVVNLTDAAKPYDIAFEAGYDEIYDPANLEVKTYAIVTLPRNVTFDGIEAHAETAPTGAAITIEMYKGKSGTVSLFSTAPSIGIGSNVISNTPAFDGDAVFISGEHIRFEITTIGSTVAGGGLTVTLKGKLT